LSKEKVNLPYSIEQNEFSCAEIEYNKKLDQLDETIKRLSIRLEIEYKYKVKSKFVKKVKSLPPMEINSVFQSLFMNKEIAIKFVSLLIDDEYLTEDERWIGKTSPLETCLAEVEQSDIYIGIISFRLGSIKTNTGKSFTQLEYEKALDLKKDILIYLRDERNSKNIG
jgi:hypothetical protein